MTPATQALAAWGDQHVDLSEARRVLRESIDQFPQGFIASWEVTKDTSYGVAPLWLFWWRTITCTKQFRYDLKLERHNFGWSGRMCLNGNRVLTFHYLETGDRLKVTSFGDHSWMLKAQPFLVDFFDPQAQKSPPIERPEGSGEPKT